MFTLAKMKSQTGGRHRGTEGKVRKETNLTKVPPTHSALRLSLELRHLELTCGAAQYIGFERGIQHWIEDDWAPHTVLSTKLTP